MESGRKKLKNLEEVEIIICQDENAGENSLIVLNETPKSTKKSTANKTMPDIIQTPRRSVRKSIKPAQDYDEIVASGKKRLRSAIKKTLVSVKDEDEKPNEEVKEEGPKWTPAKVGRVSQKRGRKSRRAAAKKQNSKDEDNKCNDKDMEGLQEINYDDTINDVEISQKVSEDDAEPNTVLENKNNNEILLIDTETETQIVEVASEPINTTFELDNYDTKLIDNSDCVFVEVGETKENSKATLQNVPKHISVDEDFEMLSLLISDDEDAEIVKQTAVKNKLTSPINMGPKILCTNIDDLSFTILGTKPSTPKSTLNMGPKIVCTNIDDLSSTILETFKPSTPKSNRPKGYRFPTPYKINTSFVSTDHNSDEDLEENKEPEEKIQNKSASIINATTKEVVLRSIRKRSLSLTVNGERLTRSARKRLPLFPAERRIKNNVTFHSPANQTAVIDDIDMLIAKSVKKDNLNKQTLIESLPETKVEQDNDNNKKQDEIVAKTTEKLESNLIEKLEMKLPQKLEKQSEEKQKKNFEDKIEEELDINVTKRRRRSLSFDESMLVKKPLPIPTKPVVSGISKLKAVTQYTSAGHTPLKSSLPKRTKLPNFAAIHEKQSNKMENIVDHIKRKAERAKLLTTSSQKRIGDSSQKPNIPKPEVDANENMRPKAVKKIDLSTIAVEQVINGPERWIPIPKPSSSYVVPSTSIKTTATATKTLKTKLPLRTVGQLTISKNNSKPAFNLSTSVKNTSFQPNAPSATKVGISNISMSTDKLAARRQRNIEMFKGRAAGSRVALNAKNDEITRIRGVRSNRRFELQMKHRQNIDQ